LPNIHGRLETEMAKIIENYGKIASGNLYFNGGLARKKTIRRYRLTLARKLLKYVAEKESRKWRDEKEE